jgi:hypothetical protein
VLLFDGVGSWEGKVEENSFMGYLYDEKGIFLRVFSAFKEEYFIGVNLGQLYCYFMRRMIIVKGIGL